MTSWLREVPVCVSVGKGRCERAAGEQVLCPLVSCYMLERVCHRWGLGCQEGVPIWFPLAQCVPGGGGSARINTCTDTVFSCIIFCSILVFLVAQQIASMPQNTKLQSSETGQFQ